MARSRPPTSEAEEGRRHKGGYRCHQPRGVTGAGKHLVTRGQPAQAQALRPRPALPGYSGRSPRYPPDPCGNGPKRATARFLLLPHPTPDFRPLAACRPARAVAMGIPAPLPLAAWRSARTPLTLFRAEGSTVGPHGPSCQLGGEAGRLAGVVHVPRKRGC